MGLDVSSSQLTLKSCSVTLGLPCKAVAHCIYGECAWRTWIAHGLVVLLPLVLCLFDIYIAAWIASASAWHVK